MAIPTTGVVTHQMIQDEFGGSYPIGLNEYYGVATGVPTSGTISNGNFRGTSAYTYTPIVADIVGGSYKYTNGGGVTAYGYSQLNKTSFLHPEAGQSYPAFGSTTQSVGMVGSYDLLGITMTDFTPTIGDEIWIVVTVSNPFGTVPNWSKLWFKHKYSLNSDWEFLPRDPASRSGANALGYGYIAWKVPYPTPSGDQRLRLATSIRWATATDKLSIHFE